MILSAVDEVLVESLGDQVMLVGVRAENAEDVGLDFEVPCVAADGKVPEMELGNGHAGQQQSVAETESVLRHRYPIASRVRREEHVRWRRCSGPRGRTGGRAS